MLYGDHLSMDLAKLVQYFAAFQLWSLKMSDVNQTYRMTWPFSVDGILQGHDYDALNFRRLNLWRPWPFSHRAPIMNFCTTTSSTGHITPPRYAWSSTELTRNQHFTRP